MLFMVFYLLCLWDFKIRAAHLSGDCFFKRELLRGYTKLRGHEQVSYMFTLFYLLFLHFLVCCILLVFIFLLKGIAGRDK